MSKKTINTLMSLVPVFAIGVTCISINLFYFELVTSGVFFKLVSYMFGYSLLSITPMIYMVYRYKFCAYSKIAVFGLLSFICFNIINQVLKAFSVSVDYALVFQCINLSVFFIGALYYLIFKNENG